MAGSLSYIGNHFHLCHSLARKGMLWALMFHIPFEKLSETVLYLQTNVPDNSLQKHNIFWIYQWKTHSEDKKSSESKEMNGGFISLKSQNILCCLSMQTNHPLIFLKILIQYSSQWRFCNPRVSSSTPNIHSLLNHKDQTKKAGLFSFNHLNKCMLSYKNVM